MSLPVRLRPLLLLVAVLLLGARALHAEEVFILDDNEFRGNVVREDADVIVVQLTGAEGRVTIRTSQLRQRYVSRDPERRGGAMHPGGLTDWSAYATGVSGGDGVTTTPVVEVPVAHDATAREDAFLGKMARVIVQSVPPDVAGRSFYALLLLGLLAGVVGLGARLAEVESLSVLRTLALAALLGAMLAIDVLHPDALTNPARALWVVPVQAAVWLGAALAIYRCGVARATLLLAFVLFSTAVLVFAGGAVLVMV